MVTSAESPAVRYVNALLADLAEKQTEATLCESENLPAVRGNVGDPPPFNQVVNRLKFLSGLDPITYSRPVSGSFRHAVRSRAWQVVTSFEDRGNSPSCRVAVRGPWKDAGPASA